MFFHHKEIFMKKILSLVLVCILLITISGCESSGNGGSYVVSFGDGLPSYKSDVKYKEVEVTEEDKKYLITNIYVYDDGMKLVLYRWENNGHSLEEIMKSEIKEYYPDSYNLVYTESDEWETKGDSHYGYFMSYAPKGLNPAFDFDRTYYIQNYFFEAGDEMVEAQFWIPATTMNLPIDGWTIDLPLGYENGALIKTEISDDAIAKYIPSIDTEYPNINIYKWENVYDSLEDYAKNELSVQYDMNSYKVYDYTDINGNSHNILLSVYDEDDDGVMETNYDYTFNIGSDYIEFDFFVEKEDDYIRYAIPAIAASIAYNK